MAFKLSRCAALYPSLQLRSNTRIQVSNPKAGRAGWPAAVTARFVVRRRRFLSAEAERCREAANNRELQQCLRAHDDAAASPRTTVRARVLLRT